jgi:chemotaxis protein histidine kinase CheA
MEQKQGVFDIPPEQAVGMPKQNVKSLIGAIGSKLTGLVGDIRDLIAQHWNEETMELIKRNGESLIAQATTARVETPEEYVAANEFFVAIAQYKKKGSAYIDPFVETFRQPWSIACDIRNQFETPAKQAREIMEKKITAYKAAERRRIEAEQARLDAERKATEEAERIKLEAKARDEKEKADKIRRDAETKARQEREEADKKRREQEEAEARARKAESDRKEAEAAQQRAIEQQDREAFLKAKAEAEAQEAKERIARDEAEAANNAARASEMNALKITDRGEVSAQEHEQKAENHEAAAQSVFHAPTIAAPTVSKTETTSAGKAIGRGSFSVTITDEMELIKAVAAGRKPLSVLNLDPERIKAATVRWAKVSLPQNTQRYEQDGLLIEATEKLSARASTKRRNDEVDEEPLNTTPNIF